MHRRLFLKGMLGAGAVVLIGPDLLWPRARALAADSQETAALIIDAHCHPLALHKIDHGDSQYWNDEAQRYTLEQMAQAGINLGFFSAVGDSFYRGNRNNAASGYEDVTLQLDQVKAWAEQGLVKIVTSWDEINTQDPMIRALLAAEGGNWLEGGLNLLQPAYDYGIRVLTIIHDTSDFYAPTLIGSSQRGVPEYGDQGLTDFGKQLITAMNEIGMVVDLSHASPQSLLDACGQTSKPVIDSHTSPRRDWADAFERGSRLRGPTEIQAIADTGGVVCLWPLGFDYAQEPWIRTTLDQWAWEVVEMMSRFGETHVGLGTDGCGGLPLMDDYKNPVDLLRLRDALAGAGLNEDQRKAFFGGNVQRVLGACLK